MHVPNQNIPKFFRKGFLFLFLLLFPHLEFSQNENVELKYQILQTTNLEDKFFLLDSLEEILWKRGEVDDYLKHSNEFLNLCLTLRKYDRAVKLAGSISYKYISKNEHDSALMVIQNLLPFEDSLQQTRNKGALYFKQAGVFFQGHDYEKAIKFYDLALERYGPDDPLEKADMNLFKGQAYSNLGEFMDAINSLQQAYLIYESYPDSQYMVSTLMEMGGVYGRNGLDKKAIEILLEVDTLAEKINSSNVFVPNSFNLSQRYGAINDEANQRKYLLKALKNLPKINYQYEYFQNALWAGLAQFHAKQGELSESKRWIDSLETTSDYYPKSNLSYCPYLLSRLNYLFAAGTIKSAQPYLEKYLEITKNWNNLNHRKHALDFAGKFYDQVGQPILANKYLKSFYHLKDSIQQKTNLNQLLFYQTAFEAEKKQKELNQEKSINRQLEKDKINTRNLMIISLAALSFLFGMIYFYRVRQQAIKKKKMQEEFAIQLIEHQENEKKRVSENLHDSLGQSLLLIKNKVILNQDKSAQKIVDQAIAEVSTISKALHPLQLEQLGLTEAIKNNIETLDESSDVFFSLKLENVDGIFSKNQELNIYRITQEVLSNVVKHSGAKACKVELEKVENEISLRVKDNGKGFNFNDEFKKIGSLGLKTLKGRVQQLNGSLFFETEKNEGTEVKFNFPISN